MIEFIRAWVTNITVVIIFIAIMEILMPQNDLKRFVRVIVGLLVILVIVKPFVFIKDVQKQFNADIAFTQRVLGESGMQDMSKEVDRKQKEMAIEVFNDHLKKQIIAIVSNENNVESKNIEVALDIEKDTQKKDYGKLKKVTITIKQNNSSMAAVSTVAPVKISLNVKGTPDKDVIKNSTNEYNFIDNNFSSQIKMSLSRALGINQKDIAVRVQE